MNDKMRKTKDGVMCTKVASVIGCVLVLSLYAAPCNAQDDYVLQSEYPWNIDSGTYLDSYVYLYVDGVLNLNAGATVYGVYLDKGGTLNMYAGAQVLEIIYVAEGTALNFHGGSVGWSVWLPTIKDNQTEPKVTVEGKDFMLNGVPYSGTKGFTPVPTDGTTLEGFYPSDDPENPDDIPIHIHFFGPVHVDLVNLEPASELKIDIDIKPGSDTNPINLKSKGVVPVAVLASLGAPMIDPATVRFAGAAPVHCTLEDVDGDGDEDMLFHFRTQELNLNEESVDATLTAQLMIDSLTSLSMTNERASVSGTDKVQILPSKSKKK